MRALSPSSLIISSAGKRYRLDLATDCPDLAQGGALLAKDGWICGMPREFVKTEARLCPVQAMQALDARSFARLMREVDLADLQAQRMAAVEVRGKRSALRGFRGSYEYCFKPSVMRAWSADNEGLVIETSKMRSGGNGRYRVELAASCGQANSAVSVTMQSSVGLDLICGNPGDVALFSDANAPDSIAGSMDLNRLNKQGCPVIAVYPLHD